MKEIKRNERYQGHEGHEGYEGNAGYEEMEYEGSGIRKRRTNSNPDPHKLPCIHIPN